MLTLYFRPCTVTREPDEEGDSTPAILSVPVPWTARDAMPESAEERAVWVARWGDPKLTLIRHTAIQGPLTAWPAALVGEVGGHQEGGRAAYNLAADHPRLTQDCSEVALPDAVYAAAVELATHLFRTAGQAPATLDLDMVLARARELSRQAAEQRARAQQEAQARQWGEEVAQANIASMALRAEVAELRTTLAEQKKRRKQGKQAAAATRAKLNQRILDLEGAHAAIVLDLGQAQSETQAAVREAVSANTAHAEATEIGNDLNQALAKRNAEFKAANLEREAILKQRDQAYADLTRAQQRLRDVREAMDD